MKVIQLRRVVMLAGLLLVFFNYKSFSQCSIPNNLHITNLTATSGILDWSSATGADSYVLKIRPSGSSTWIRIESGNSNETVTGLLPNTNTPLK